MGTPVWQARMAFATESLCETCQHMREVRTARSRFLLCELSVTNSRFPKYPPQPVVRCSGYRPPDGPEDAKNQPNEPPGGDG